MFIQYMSAAHLNNLNLALSHSPIEHNQDSHTLTLETVPNARVKGGKRFASIVDARMWWYALPGKNDLQKLSAAIERLDLTTESQS